VTEGSRKRPGKRKKEQAARPLLALAGMPLVSHLARSHWKALALAFIAVLGETAADVAEPWPVKIVIDNVLLPAEILGLPMKESRERAKDLLALVGLAGAAAKRPYELSGGMQQRASIARALSFDPALLLMDEPFGALDEIVRDHLNEQLLRLWDKTNKTVVFVTHSIPEAVFLSTKIVVMSPRPGRIIDIIDCDFPRERTLEIRETPEFIKIAGRVRNGLRAGHSYDE